VLLRNPKPPGFGSLIVVSGWFSQPGHVGNSRRDKDRRTEHGAGRRCRWPRCIYRIVSNSDNLSAR
jgi:hypothetical protein